jgi:hypothetical protein
MEHRTQRGFASYFPPPFLHLYLWTLFKHRSELVTDTPNMDDQYKLDDKDAPVHLEGDETERAKIELLELAELQAKFPDERRKKLLRKVDWRLVPVLATYYLLAWIDRGNAGKYRLGMTSMPYLAHGHFCRGCNYNRVRASWLLDNSQISRRQWLLAD